jgi:uncharacterized protein (TIGR04255 family)
MPLSLPEAHHHPLARTPLAVVVFQVRFEQSLSVGDGETGLLFHEDLGGRDGYYPVVETQQIVGTQLQIGPQGISPFASNIPPSRGFRMKSADGEWTVALMPDFIAVETTAYTSWKYGFKDRIKPVLEAAAKRVNPRIEERVGLRYVNRITEAGIETPSEFSEIISKSLLGPVADEFWGCGITATQQQLEFEIDSDIRGILRHGTLSKPTGVGVDGYLLDIDLFRQQPRSFSVDGIAQVANELNAAATGLFKASISPAFLKRLEVG